MTTIDIPLVADLDIADAVEDPAVEAARAEQRYLESVRRRVAWQAEQAAQLRAATAQPEVDPLDIGTLWQLVESRPEAPRFLEWRAFLVELRELADDRGRLPEFLERLVRVVFDDLL